MKQYFLLLCSFFFANNIFAKNSPPADTIIQSFHRADKVKPEGDKALLMFTMKNTERELLEGVTIWLCHERSGQHWQGTTDAKGEVFFLVPNNRPYRVDVEGEKGYKKLSIPPKDKYFKSIGMIYMSARVKEQTRGDTVYQQLTQGQMPSASRVLVKINISDLENKTLPNERMFFNSERTGLVYSTATDKKGTAMLMLPKGDTYCVHTDFIRDIRCKTYEKSNTSRTTTIRLNTISSVEFRRREAERARWLAERDAALREQRRRDSARISEISEHSFYLQHYYADKAHDEIRASIERKAGKDRAAIAVSPHYYEEQGDEIRAMLYRNKDEWKSKRIVANIDCSMYRYIDELLVWNFFSEEESANNNYWLFNGFKNDHRDDHHSRGIYRVPDNTVESFMHTIDKIVNFRCGGSRLENVVEALLIAAKEKAPGEDLLFIADNFSDVSDLGKLAQLKVPVSVLLTASGLGINENYLEIAYRSGGSVHTLNEDIPSEKLKSLKDGDTLIIGKFAYRFFKGRFLKTV